MIEINNLTKIYQGTSFEVTALCDVSLKINDGEFVAIMGESGSGKSTLLNCIGLIDSFDEGEYIIDDVKVHELSIGKKNLLRKEKISFVFQNFELMRNYTLYENIEVPLLAKNVKKNARKKLIHEMAEKFGIEELLKKYPYQVSGGQQQRTAVARALISDNPYILADEPTGALDSKNSVELIHELKKINETGKTVLMVTHDPNMAEFADRIIHIDDGKILNNNG
ncbi:MAG: ABC transporter ATP-binding protein [Clostridium sp.]|nr:ABC transporter ATP-binding protein [Clostridium sp.]MCM1460255.1 ABC transporter ATP-binding protein [Bacteroides sp.]